MTEQDFETLVEGIDLNDSEKAILRKKYELPHDASKIPTTDYFQKQVLVRALKKIERKKR